MYDGMHTHGASAVRLCELAGPWRSPVQLARDEEDAEQPQEDDETAQDADVDPVRAQARGRQVEPLREDLLAGTVHAATEGHPIEARVGEGLPRVAQKVNVAEPAEDPSHVLLVDKETREDRHRHDGARRGEESDLHPGRKPADDEGPRVGGRDEEHEGEPEFEEARAVVRVDQVGHGASDREEK